MYVFVFLNFGRQSSPFKASLKIFQRMSKYSHFCFRWKLFHTGQRRQRLPPESLEAMEQRSKGRSNGELKDPDRSRWHYHVLEIRQKTPNFFLNFR